MRWTPRRTTRGRRAQLLTPLLICLAPLAAAQESTPAAPTPPPAGGSGPSYPSFAPAAPEGEATDEATPDADEAQAAVASQSVELQEPLTFSGYIDAGWAKAGGNGTSFVQSDTRLPVDYGVDPFQTMVNTRGDVASTSSDGQFVNGFLPRSMDIGSNASFLLNAVNFDLRYLPNEAPVMVFTRVQVLPHFARGRGNNTWVFVEQAFGRVSPIKGRELTVSFGKFDSVFGIEYLENASTFRTGITPSLLARYTTGTSVGGKIFFRQQIAPLWSAFSLNVAATNSGTFIEALQPPDVSLTGEPVLSGRLGYELNLPGVQIKLGGSGLHGPRNDQERRRYKQTMWGADARLYLFGLSLAGEYVDVREDEGGGPKETGLGRFPIVSGFEARGFWAQAAYAILLDSPLRSIVPYARYEQRRAEFEGWRPIKVTRVTAGLRLDFWQSLALKGEVLLNDEKEGAPQVDNDVITTSAVWSW